MILGNDVSSFQGDINFDIYKNNANFVICKATEGNGFTDPKFLQNQSEARRVGLPIGYYHFARPDLNNSPGTEADYFFSKIGPLQDGEVLFLDYEANWNGDVVGWCKQWLDHLQSSANCKPLIYLNQSLISSFDWKPVVDAGYGLWIAAYTYDPNNNTFNQGQWPFAAMQQWSNAQMVPGISGGVDGDVFFGTIDAFKAYGFKNPTPIPPVDPCADLQTKFDALQKDDDAKHNQIVDLDNQIASLNATVTSLNGQIATLKDQLAHIPPSTIPEHKEYHFFGRTIWVLNI